MEESGRSDRRSWLKGLLGRGAGLLGEGVEAALRGRVTSWLRPPGAVGEAAFLAGCTRCDACVEACPHQAVLTLNSAAGVAAGTPVMDPARRPCRLCEGFPCAAACPEGVLLVPAGERWRLGVATLDPGACLPYRGPECGACAGLCPPSAEGGLRFQAGRPLVDPERCLGCGLCLPACPTRALFFSPPVSDARSAPAGA